jgi:hypothetical protein
MVCGCLYTHDDLLPYIMPTLKYGSQCFALRNPKYKSDEKNNNSRCRMTLCADENLKVSFESIQCGGSGEITGGTVYPQLCLYIEDI